MEGTIANKYLIQSLIRELNSSGSHNNYPLNILNIGASTQTFIENDLSNAGCDYSADRIDIANCKVSHPSIKQCMQCSVELMHPVKSEQYDLAFANWVLEHVPDLNLASKEIYRILKPSGKFIATIPNPNAPEFLFAKLTPLWIHKIIRGRNVNAWETYYSYSNIAELVRIFNSAGFRVLEIKYYPTIESYLSRFLFLGSLGKLYDNIVSALQIKSLSGHVSVIFQKPSSELL